MSTRPRFLRGGADGFAALAADSTGPGGSPDVFWQFRPFRGGLPARIQDLLKALSYTGPDPATRAAARKAVGSWADEPHFASVRGPALDELPPVEREAWTALWREAASLAAGSP